jgi:hypothetical protein
MPLRKTAGVRSREIGCLQERRQVLPNSVPVVISIVSADEEHCTIGEPRPFDRVAAHNTRPN